MNPKDKTHAADVNAVTTKPFLSMTATEKVKHVAKVIVFILTFGFAYPNVFSD